MGQRLINIFILILSVLGIIDAGYLTLNHYLNEGVVCAISGSCDTVLTSKYSEFLGVPVSLFGLFMYAIIFVVVLAAFIQRDLKLNKFIFIISFFGVLFSGYFIFVQAFILKAWCEYCVFSAINITVIFVLVFSFNRILRLKSQSLK